MKILIQLIVLSLLTINAYGQIGRLHLSPRQTIQQNIGLTNIEIELSRPSMRDRKVFGGLVEYDKYWRTGANQNTTISFDQKVFLNGAEIKKGKYSIITKPNIESWDFLIYDETSNWDVPEIVDTSKIVAKINVLTRKLQNTKEVLAIEIGDFTNYKFDLNISWENTTVSIPFELNTRQLMDAKINNELNGPEYGDYYLAAVYQMESGKEYEQGLKWINKAIELNEERGWWDLRVKAILLMELNRMTEAKVLAEEGLALVTEIKRNNMIAEFNRILNEIKN